MHVGCRSENWCFCMSYLVCLRVGDIDFDAIFSVSSEMIALSGALHGSHLRRQVGPQFSRNCRQKLRKVQKSAEKFVHTTSNR